MKFVAFVVTEGAMPAEAIAEMNRDWPAYAEEVKRHGGLRVGRELSLPEAGVATVRVRGGETLVTDGPFLETKEFVAGIELFESADLDEAIEVESRNPVARFNPFELRPVPEAFRVGPELAAFESMDDRDGVPYLLTVWVDASTGPPDPSISEECEAWRARMGERGVFVLGGAVGAPEAATTLRAHDGSVQACAGPFLEVPEFIAAIEVVRARDAHEAAELAAAHPLARQHAIEVRAFYSEAAQSQTA